MYPPEIELKDAQERAGKRCMPRTVLAEEQYGALSVLARSVSERQLCHY